MGWFEKFLKKEFELKGGFIYQYVPKKITSEKINKILNSQELDKLGVVSFEK